MKPRLRASNMARALGCPGSSVIAPLVKERDRDDGYFGVWAHHQIASRAIAELGAFPPKGGLPPAQVPPGYKPPQNSLWMIDWCVRHIRETIPADWALMVEFEFEHEFEDWIGTGHADIVAQSPDGKRIKAKDWKMVFVPVDDAGENDQVLTYAVLIKLDWPETEEIEFEICSPRLSQEERITSVTVSGDDLDRCVASLDSRVKQSIKDQDTLTPGPKQCKLCIGCACPAIREELMKITPEILAQMKDAPSDAQLGDFVIMARTLAVPIKEATEILHERLDAQGSLVAGNGITITRKIQKGDYDVPDNMKFMSAVRTVLPSDEEVADVVTFSMTRIKDKIAARMDVPKTSKNGVSAESIFDGHLRPLVVQNEKRILVLT